MKITVDIDRYMDGRTTVMGIAAILVTWFHSNIVVDPGSFLELFKRMGDVGVDLFLLASGVGIFLASNKHASYGSYLSRRVRRVLIPYLCVCIPWYYYQKVIYSGGFLLFFKRLLMLDFWLDGELKCWYIAGILFLYVVTPFYVRLWKKHHWLHAGTFAFVMAGCLFLGATINRWEVFLCRIPVYLLGLSLGKLVQEKRNAEVSLPLAVGALLGGIVVILACLDWLPLQVLWRYKYLAYMPVAAWMSMLFARIPANKFLNYFGTRSLEIYLLFEKVLEILSSRPQMEVFMGSTGIVFNAIVLSITLICAEILRWGCKMIDVIWNKLELSLCRVK